MHTLTIHNFEPSDPRLGRHVHHDSRSLDHEFLPRDAKPKGTNTSWMSSTGPLNQGQVGSCTGNATAQWMNTDFADTLRPDALPSQKQCYDNGFLTEKNALLIYHVGTELDHTPGTYPPKDTGCSGIFVAQAAEKAKLITKYSHTFSASAALAADEITPSIQGTVWTKQMFTPNNGLVTVGKITDSTVAGGHEYLRCGVDFTEEVVIYRNSWGDQDAWPGCKPGGYFAMSFKDVEALLAEQGDVTILNQ